MRKFIRLIPVLIAFIQSDLSAQVQPAPRQYSHSVVVDSVLQTKNYTYLKVIEKIAGKDSSIWLALPLFEPKRGDVYYYESGLQMGEFRSRELNRTFSEILFLAGLSTSLEVSEKTIVGSLKPAREDTVQQVEEPLVIHTVVVKEVLQTSGYTYLRVIEGENEKWLAVIKIPAKVGKVYTYEDAAPMKDFTSKELKRTFSEIYFLSRLTEVGKEAEKEKEASAMGHQTPETGHGKNSSGGKKNVKIEQVHGSLSVATLLESKLSFSGKTVQVRGEVTKVSSDIMSRNWIHLEDGTSYKGKSDLVVTTDQVVKVGDVVTFEGVLHTDKDFGSGYFFDVIVEDAVMK